VKRFIIAGKALVELDIEDNYSFGDVELNGMLKISLARYF